MKHKILNEHDERTIALVFDAGDEPVQLLTRFAADYNIRSARFSAIGAFSEVVLGYFDIERKEYLRNPIQEQVEVVSLLGDITLAEGKPNVHAHVVVAGRDGLARGGHLLSASVKPTLEVLLIESPRHLARTYRPEFGLALIDVGA
jgi:predicted DNA-binding protein with PD1-like motif